MNLLFKGWNLSGAYHRDIYGQKSNSWSSSSVWYDHYFPWETENSKEDIYLSKNCLFIEKERGYSEFWRLNTVATIYHSLDEVQAADIYIDRPLPDYDIQRRLVVLS